MRKSRLSYYKQARLLELFIAGSTARIAAELVGVHRNTAAYYFHRLRMLIAENVKMNSWFTNEITLDEMYLGGQYKEEGIRRFFGKKPIFGLLKRGDKIYTKIIPDDSSYTLLPIIESIMYFDGIVYTDNFVKRSLSVSDFKHYKIHHCSQFFEQNDRQENIKSIDNFWIQVKRHMCKFNGVPKAHFELYLKECEWRFNTPSTKKQLTLLRKIVKSQF
ncbi:TPA: IS1595 family transposase [Providencia alcalifaciens]